jgi:hypothetical protein
MLAVTPSVTGCGDGRWRFSRRGSEMSEISSRSSVLPISGLLGSAPP